MAVNIKPHKDGYILEGKFYLCFSEPEKNYINLMLTKGEEMRYQNDENKDDAFTIDYPGEYDKDSVTIKVVSDKGDSLNYLLKYNNQNVAFVQSAHALEDEDFATATHWMFVDPFISKTIDKMELEGEKIDLKEMSEE